MTLLRVENLTVGFEMDGKTVTAVDRVSFNIGAGETVALVGESGCGKSMTSLAIMGLVPALPGRNLSGVVRLSEERENLLEKRKMREVRGRDIAMIFQEPMTSLNPVFTCGAQIVEAIRSHKKISKAEARTMAVQLLELAGIPMPESRFGDYPHQMSGGMRQRVMIAMALSSSPRLLIADEPTTALDATIQAQILDLLRDLQRRLGMALLLITHDFGVVAEMAGRVVVMYAGRTVETAGCLELFQDPKHPYTMGLLRSLPRVDARGEELYTIPGTVPALRSIPQGCAFHPRCFAATPLCKAQDPPSVQIAPGRWVACWLHAEGVAS
jgi:oligopeptide/dipeptide ABC transporter ATP-binding protein